MPGQSPQESQPISFSVAIPNFNHAAFLPQCLDSVLAQSVQPAAIYVLDDASTDRSVELLRDYRDRHPVIHLIENKVNRGVVANMNGILAELPTTHVFFLGADDYLLPGFFEAAYPLLAEHPGMGICMADVVDLHPDGSEHLPRPRLTDEAVYYPPEQIANVARGRGIIGQCFFLVKGLRKIGGFDPGLRWFTDHFTCWVLATRYGLGYVPMPGSVYRVSSTSYCGKGMKGPEQAQVLIHALEYLLRPEFEDVRDRLRDSHALAIFEEQLLPALRREPQYHYFLTPSLRWMFMRRKLRLCFRHPVPAPVKQWFRPRTAAE